jgi:medium-chain acyl-[acyl-carrier-protein] hydrolase
MTGPSGASKASQAGYVVLGPSPASGRALVCFHYAGGSAQSFFSWRPACSGRCELVAAELPGRGRRQGAPFVTSLVEAAEQLALAHLPLPQRQTVFYGHSLGALLAFETARILQRRGFGGPSCLIVSSRAAPGSSHMRVGLPNLSDADLRHYLGEIEGTPKVLLENAALMDFAIPPLRSDLGLIYNYAFQPGPILDIPIEAIGALDDKWAPLEGLLGWRSLTSAAFRLRMIAGGHFAATSSPELILETMDAYRETLPLDTSPDPPRPLRAGLKSNAGD